jgi:hypothetical protein
MVGELTQSMKRLQHELQLERARASKAEANLVAQVAALVRRPAAAADPMGGC